MSPSWTLLYGFTTLLCVYLATIVLKRSRLDLDKMPSPPANFLTGHMTQLLAPNFHRVFTAWAQTYGSTYRISILGFPGIVVSDPAIIGQLLGYGTNGGELPKNVDSYQQLDRVSRCESTLQTREIRLLRKRLARPQELNLLQFLLCSCGVAHTQYSRTSTQACSVLSAKLPQPLSAAAT